MIKKLLKIQFLWTALILLGTIQNSHSQEFKTEHDPSINKGHALYKKTKIYDNKNGKTDQKILKIGDRALDRNDYEFNMLKNPYSGKIPEKILELESQFSNKIKTSQELQQAVNKTANRGRSRYSYWKQRGPYNVGGRTRALALDIINENIIFAGGVSGGLWRSTNGGSKWNKVTSRRQAPSITSIVQDTRKGHTHVWYYSSGERSGNSASAGGAFYSGTGVYKSINRGKNWRLLSSTADGNNTSGSNISPFDLVNSMAIHPVNGDLYVATFNGVHRSQDGGNTFTEVLAGGFDSWTEVMITPSGKIYATVDFYGEPNSGLFTSNDGDSWTQIEPEGTFFRGRTVMTHDPSNEDIIYFFSENLLSPSAPLLFKYNAAESDSLLQFTDLSNNLPTSIGGPVGNLNLQGRYNMIIKVHPNNSDVIILGGTNLYRSNTGFTTPAGQESWIAGYSPLNNIGVYPNQHPDQHNLLFYPSNPDKVLSANDGGVFLTEDITASNSTAEPVSWVSLNNGYFTTQPYTVSFDPESENSDLLAGFQDNGSWFTNSNRTKAEWIEDFGGDGSYNAIADNGATRYVSAQGGIVYRLNFDSNGDNESFTRVQPAGASGFRFIAPFILDHNNDNIMYMPAGSTMWRNNDLDGIPLFSNSSTDVNWVQLDQTTTSDGSSITALDVSKFPIANRLYFGTSTGKIYRMDNANLDEQQVTDISTGKGLPPGNISNISVDPINPDRLIVIFSNYEIPSIFITNNGGDTWKDISGNLEENSDGSGNGPSVRWAAFHGKKNGYFVGTSTGLYYTFKLKGNRTYWWKEPFRIGNAVAGQIKTRKDGFAVVATHGNGMYSAKFPVSRRPESKLEVAYLLKDTIVDINSKDIIVDVKGLFQSKSRRPIDIKLTNSNPSLVSAVLQDDNILLSIAPDAEGTAAIGLIATQGREQVTEGFTVQVTPLPIYKQRNPIAGSSPSQFFVDFGATAESADDFVVPDGVTWSINGITALGGANNSPEFNSVTVIIYEDDNGNPGNVFYNSGEIVPVSEVLNANLKLELPETVNLESGKYWISVFANLAFNPNQTQWFWSTQDQVTGNENVFRDAVDLFGTGATDWTTQSLAFGRTPRDHVFEIYGTIGLGDAVPETEDQLVITEVVQSSILEDTKALTTVNSKFNKAVWPNPSTSKFHFSMRPDFLGSAELKVYNYAGQEVYQQKNLKADSSVVWDASTMPTGLYILHIKGQYINRQVKLIKQ